jgi:hypothetical protein
MEVDLVQGGERADADVVGVFGRGVEVAHEWGNDVTVYRGTSVGEI